MAELRLLFQKYEPETAMLLPSRDSVFPADRFSGEDKIMGGRIMGSERTGPTECVFSEERSSSLRLQVSMTKPNAGVIIRGMSPVLAATKVWTTAEATT